jgi:hypothetical protein
MNQDFLDYCKVNSDKPLPVLFNNFRRKHSNFDLNEFIYWKSGSNRNDLIEEFHNYPFLRDQLFLSFIKSSFKLDSLTNLEKFILKTQAEYFKKFLNPEFDQKILENSSKVSNCPFAPKTTSSPIKSFSYESISRIRYSLIENTHISDMNFNNLTVNIVKPDCERSIDSKFTVLVSGIHHNLDFNNPKVQYILMTDTKISNSSTIPVIGDHRLPCNIINEIIRVKPYLTGADALFLFPENVLLINPCDIDRVLNIIVYLNILNLPFDFNFLKSVGLTSKTGGSPSSLEPYADILTLEYIQNNVQLFQ